MRVMLWGGGGHAKVVADVVRAAGHEVVGAVDLDAAKLGQQIEPGGCRVLHTQEAFLETLDEARDLDAVALAVGDNAARLRLFTLLVGRVDLPPFVHPSAVVSPSAEIGDGTVVMPGVIVNAATRVGRAVILNTGCVVEHDNRIGDGVHISPNATTLGTVTVGARSWIGGNATVLPGLEVGMDTIVGAAATVTTDIGDAVTVVGTPALPLRRQR